MATDKLTLSVDKQTIILAKALASENKTSVSKLFKELITSFPRKAKGTDPLLEKFKDTKIPPEILSLRGILKGKFPHDMDYKDMKWEYLKERHGL